MSWSFAVHFSLFCRVFALSLDALVFVAAIAPMALYTRFRRNKHKVARFLWLRVEKPFVFCDSAATALAVARVFTYALAVEYG